jgi:deazaflavin-dependent oxidoreductase (nitroreductase family)
VPHPPMPFSIGLGVVLANIQPETMPAKKPAAGVRKALEVTEELELTVTGRVSGDPSTRPVWFVVTGKNIFLIPVSGSDSRWYQNVLANPQVTLAADDGVKWTAAAKPISDPAKVHEVVEMFWRKYGTSDIEQYYKKTDVAVTVPLP